jgi:hypothetical protein
VDSHGNAQRQSRVPQGYLRKESIVAYIVSSLPLPDQAAHLRVYLARYSATLSDTAAQNVCRYIMLNKPGDSRTVGRKLVVALAAHGVVIKRSNALEALARICAQPNCMRTLQTSLPFGDAAPKDATHYIPQATRDGETYVAAETFATYRPLQTDCSSRQRTNERMP